MITLTPALANGLLASGSFKNQMDGSKIYIFGGTVPTNAAAALTVPGTHQALCTVANAGSGVTFDSSPANGVMSKTAAETWSGVNGASGTATFFRICQSGDNGQAADDGSKKRIQGTIGTDVSFDATVASTTLTNGNTFTFNTAQIVEPQA